MRFLVHIGIVRYFNVIGRDARVAKGSLGRSLDALREEDRLAAAWPVACGKALAERGSVTGYRMAWCTWRFWTEDGCDS